MTQLTQSAIQPPAERYFIFFGGSVLRSTSAKPNHRYNGQYNGPAGLKAFEGDTA